MEWYTIILMASAAVSTFLVMVASFEYMRDMKQYKNKITEIEALLLLKDYEIQKQQEKIEELETNLRRAKSTACFYQSLIHK